MQFPLSSRVLFFLYKSECVVLKIEVPPLSGPRRYVHFGVCAAQSASFALATTRPPDGLLNASRPTTQLRTILYKIIRRSRGRQDAIDFVTIALPSLRSLRHSHRRVSSSCYATSPAWRYATECHAFSYCAHKAHARRKQANRCRSCKDESAVFVVWEEEHKEPKRTTATSCGWSNGACVRRVRHS